MKTSLTKSNIMNNKKRFHMSKRSLNPNQFNKRRAYNLAIKLKMMKDWLSHNIQSDQRKKYILMIITKNNNNMRKRVNSIKITMNNINRNK